MSGTQPDKPDRRPDRVKRVQGKSVTELALGPWIDMVKFAVYEVREVAVFGYYVLLAYVLPAAIAFAVLMGGIMLYVNLTA